MSRAGERAGSNPRRSVSIRVMSTVWASSPARGAALLLLLAIADFADDQGRAFPSVTTLAAKTRMSESNVHRMIRALVCAGSIRVERQMSPAGTDLVNRYHVLGCQLDTLRVPSRAQGEGANVGTQNLVRNRHKNARAREGLGDARCPECRHWDMEHGGGRCRTCQVLGRSCAGAWGRVAERQAAW